MSTQYAILNRSEITFVIKEVKRGKTLNGLPAQLFIAVPEVLAKLLLPHIRKCWESDVFLNG